MSCVSDDFDIDWRHPAIIRSLNKRLEGLGRRGRAGRFAWRWAPDQPMFFYDRDDRTLIKKCWADAPAPDGGRLGAVWLLAEWRTSNTYDHMGFTPVCDLCEGRGKRDEYGIGVWQTCSGCNGRGRAMKLRLAHVRDAGYAPYFETALLPGQVPTEEITQQYMWLIDRQLGMAAENDPRSFEKYMADEKSTTDNNERQQRAAWQETAAEQYDNHVGAFGNCEPGKRDGYLSFGGI